MDDNSSHRGRVERETEEREQNKLPQETEGGKTPINSNPTSSSISSGSVENRRRKSGTEAEMKETSDGFVRADQIDLKSLDELERHLTRAWTVEKKQEERAARQEWEIDPSKLIIKSVIARGTFGTVHRGIYDGQDVAGKTSVTYHMVVSFGYDPSTMEQWPCFISGICFRMLLELFKHTFFPGIVFIQESCTGIINKARCLKKHASTKAGTLVFLFQVVLVKLLDWGEEGHRTEAENASLRAAFTQEVAVWHKLDHPNVTKFIGATMGSSELNIQTENGQIGMPSNVCCVVVEYLPGGALKSYLIKNRRRKLAFKVVVQLALDLARGLSYLHSKKIVHRDVKTENMLLDKTRTVKIADFGVARVEAQNPNDMTGETGTLGYMAPEVLNGNPYNRKCDVYSFGICLWEIYCCDMPYPDLSFSEVTSAVVRQNLRPEIPRCCPSSLANVMKRCWDANPDKRPEMDEVVAMIEVIDTSKGGGMIPLDQQQGCLCFRRHRGP